MNIYPIVVDIHRDARPCSSAQGSEEMHTLLRKSQGNSPRFAGSTKLRTVSFHVPLFYDPMYNLSIFYHLSILQSISQSFHNLLLFTISSNHHLIKPSITFTESFLLIYSFRKYTPHCVYLRLMQLNVCHILTRIIKVFTQVPAIPARFFSICRLFLVAINNNHYIFWPVT